MATKWVEPPKTAPFNVGTALLLTDGSVFAQDDFTANWWRLRPDAQGEYAAGTWTQAPSAKRRRLYFASAVLADGRVFVAGGKYAEDVNTPADLLAAEIYDPVKDAWTGLPVPEGWKVLGNAPCCVLPDATVLVGNIKTGECAIFDPARGVWKAAVAKLNGSAKGETWTLLPDGSVLTADCLGHPRAERFEGGVWKDAGPVMPDLVEDGSSEIGPAILMCDGKVFAVGTAGKTAIYTPQNAGQAGGPWSAGPPLPKAGGVDMASKNAPACLLPCGQVLLVAGAADGTATTLYIYDAKAAAGSALSAALAPVPALVDIAPSACRLLLLPNGQVMLSTSTPRVLFYADDARPDAGAVPVITQAPWQAQAGHTYALRGRGLNGLSQACAYGDDAGMATNYPLVRLSTKASPAEVTYCRTAGHSTMGVATGASGEATNFTVPNEVAPGDYLLCVVANGVASAARAITIEAGAPAAAAAEPALFEARDLQADKILQEEMFWRDLNEVHLLMDFISGRADRSLTDMKMLPDPSAAPDSPVNISPQEALRRVCQVRFPPEGGPDQKAANAAMLLLVKDGLNALADPARGLTVAFTSMFAGTGGESPEMAARRWRPFHALGRVWNFLFSTQEAIVKRRGGPGPGFAIASYPNLEGQARWFRRYFDVLPWLALIWLMITALTYWDVAMSSKTLSGSAAVITETSCKIATAPDGTKSATAFPPELQTPCGALLKAENAGNQPYGYAGLDLKVGLFAASGVWHPVGWIVSRFGPPKGGLPTQETSAFATVVVAVFTDYILPMMFGVLGTFAGVMRAITGKVRESTLSPRDSRLVFSLIPLGAVAGLSIGLIMTPATAAAGTPLTLTGAGLAFLAGYGADAFFGMIDGALKRIFSLTPAPGAGGSK